MANQLGRVVYVPMMVVPYNINNLQYYDLPANNRSVDDFIPHPLTQSEIEVIRGETLTLIDKIHRLRAAIEANPARHCGLPDRNERYLYLAEEEYKLRFCRVFRINDLPVEVLDRIFRFIVWSTLNNVSDINWRLWLTWVCRRWRRVAIRDSMIWSSIWFGDGSFERSFEWFERARSAPLDIRLVDGPYFTFTGDFIGSVIDRLFTKIHQIRLFIAQCEEKATTRVALEKLQIFARQKGPMMLECINLRCTGVYSNAFKELKNPIPLIGGVFLPNLKHVSLDIVAVDWQKSRLTDLTSLDLCRMPQKYWPDLHHFRTLLASSPNLRVLCLDATSPQCLPGEAERLEPILLPRLNTLIYANLKVNIVLYVAKLIQAPNLRALTLSNFLMKEDYTRLFAFLTGRLPNLRILGLHSINVPPSLTMVRWLTSIPELMLLRVWNIQPHVLNFFHCLPDPAPTEQESEIFGPESMLKVPIVCPKLSILDLQIANIDWAIHWISQRTKMGYPIRKIYMSTVLSYELTDAQRLRLSDLGSLYELEPATRPPEEEQLLWSSLTVNEQSNCAVNF